MPIAFAANGFDWLNGSPEVAEVFKAPLPRLRGMFPKTYAVVPGSVVRKAIAD